MAVLCCYWPLLAYIAHLAAFSGRLLASLQVWNIIVLLVRNDRICQNMHNCPDPYLNHLQNVTFTETGLYGSLFPYNSHKTAENPVETPSGNPRMS